MSNEKEDLTQVTNTEAFNMLLHRALKEEPTEFKLIAHHSEYKAYKKMRDGVSKAAKIFQNLATQILCVYIEDTKQGKQDINSLLACREFYKCRDFYLHEHYVVDDMIKEYQCYLRWGHRLGSWLGLPRLAKDMTDYRRIPIKFF